MTDAIISVENMGKRYRIGVREKEPENLRDAVGSLLGSPFRYLRQMTRLPTEEETLWALKDVSFEVRQGEVLGIVGRNGAGKSTLLKILSRITEPTEGRAIVNGRIGTLLEVGTGFHPELTGRENTYLNGAILGMKRQEIDRKFDEIVAFAEIDEFIDTPVKRYSSGMYVRLAFAVAAHLEPDILVVDEVLAVGDNRFQKKSLDKMSEVTSHGRTVLFVSHSMPAISRICQSAILLDRGQLVVHDQVDRVITRYLSNNGASSAAEWLAGPYESTNRSGVVVKRVRVLNSEGLVSESHNIDVEIQIEVVYDCLMPLKDVHVQVQVFNDAGTALFASADNLVKDRLHLEHPPGRYCSVCIIPPNFLAEGRHIVKVVTINLNDREKYNVHFDVAAIWVRDPSDGTTVRGNWAGEWPGVLRPMLDWKIQQLADEDMKDHVEN